MRFLLIFLFLGLICAEDYMSYDELNKQMRLYGTLFSSENVPYIVSKTMVIGKSTQQKDMIAYCYGNCETGRNSVFPLSHNLLVFINGWHPWKRGLIDYVVSVLHSASL